MGLIPVTGQTELFARKASNPAIVPYQVNRAIVLKGNVVYASQPSKFTNNFEDQRLLLTFMFGKP